LQPDDENVWYFNPKLFDKGKGIRIEFVSKTQFPLIF